MVASRQIPPNARLNPRLRPADFASRNDGCHALEPLIGSLLPAGQSSFVKPEDALLDALHNEGFPGASAYPLRLKRGEYFSEALGDANGDAGDYATLIHASLSILRDRSRFRPMSLQTLYASGREIQEMDRAFAASRIGQSLDYIHRRVGSDEQHPYAKTTIVRTTFPVEVNGQEVMFLYEKFLVNYCYLDINGRRRSTVTPIHSHPLNFETAYFTHFGAQSIAIEQEFFLSDADGLPLIDEKDEISAAFSSRLDWNTLRTLRAEPGPKTRIIPSEDPALLPAFGMETALQADEARMTRFDGLFRPHRVEVVDDPANETRYFALDNYFGPVCRVLLFDESGAIKKWRRDEWSECRRSN